MTHRPHKVDQATWQQCEIVLLQFEAALRGQEDTPLEEFLPDESTPTRDYLLRELIKIDLEFRWSQGQETFCEEYAARFPELSAQGDFPLDLIKDEFRTRRMHHAAAPTAEEIQRRFPDQSDTLLTFLVADRSSSDSSQSVAADDTMAADSTEVAPSQHRPKRLGRYELQEEIGRGSFAKVYRAVDPELKRNVAIKVPKADLIEIPEMRQRLVREAQSAARLHHPGIVPTFEVGEHQGRPYIVSEFIDGVSLDAYSKQHPPSPREAANWVAQVADALHYAHQCGIIHRDIKPANFLMHDGRPMLTDFGLAHQVDAEATLTLHGDILGTPAYMSPEQARGDGGNVNARTDIYSLGVVLYQLMCNELPFQGTTASLLHRLQTEEPPTPRRVNSSIDRDLETICLKCLEKHPQDRYKSAADLASDLQCFANGQPIAARPVGATERIWKWSKRHPALALLASVVLVLLSFLLGAALQLNAVRTQRDRAVSAESERTELLTESLASAGMLSMQRGKFRDAVELYERSLADGYQDSLELELKKIEAFAGMRQLEKAKQLLDNIKSPPTPQRQGMVLMWQAEFALRGENSSTQSIELFQKALELPIPAADRAYAEGMLATSSPAAVTHFERALAADPFHHRSRVMMVTVLTLLGQLDEARLRTTIAGQLYPEDPYFTLLDAFIVAAQGDLQTAEKMVEQVRLPASDAAAWKQTLGLVSSFTTKPPEVALNYHVKLQEMLQDLVDARDSLQTVSEYGLHFTPRVNQRVQTLRESLPRLLTGGHAEIKQAVSDLVDVHTEGALLLWKGELQIADRELVEARDTFLQAVATTSVVPDQAASAHLGVVATTVMLALVKNQDKEANLAHCLKALEQVDPALTYKARYCRVFTQASIAGGRADLASLWWKKWSEHPDAEQKSLIWHQIEVEKMNRRFVDAIMACDRLLEIDPESEHAKISRAESEKLLRQTLQP